ncbi:hypothetical protein Gohar_025165, partial [Gossypium harknessii]|nr:hypothetical protein [Gossypium harknessii]
MWSKLFPTLRCMYVYHFILDPLREQKIGLALLNARLSAKSFRHWSRPVLFPLISLLLSKFSLIAPLSSVQAIHFQLLQAPPFSIKFSGDLKYAVDEYEQKDTRHIEYLQKQLSQKQTFSAVIMGVHNILVQTHPDIVTIIVPRHPQHGQEIAEMITAIYKLLGELLSFEYYTVEFMTLDFNLWAIQLDSSSSKSSSYDNELQKGGQNVALRSQHKELIPGISIYLVDTL